MTSKKCMTRECSICHDMIDGFAPQAHSESLPYYQWKSTDNRIEKLVATDTVDIIFNELKKQLNTFLLHTFVKREQAATFNSLKSSSDGISIVLQVDFSENVMIVAQKEVQSAHWHHPQATLFTAHAWINNDNNFSMVIIQMIPTTSNTAFLFYAVHFSKPASKISKHTSYQYFQRWTNFLV